MQSVIVYLKEYIGEIKFHLKEDTEKVIARLDKNYDQIQG